MAATQTVLGLTANVIVAAAMLLANSGAWALFDMTAVTMRQRLAPARLLGRVTSLYSTVAYGAETLGALAGGSVAAAAGIRAPMLAGALPIAAVAAALAWRYRHTKAPADPDPAPAGQAPDLSADRTRNVYISVIRPLRSPITSRATSQNNPVAVLVSRRHAPQDHEMRL